MRTLHNRVFAVMAAIFVAGGIARSAYQYGGVQWLRGAAQIIWGLMWLVPAGVLVRLLLQRDSVHHPTLFLGRAVMVLFCLLAGIGLLGLGIYAYAVLGQQW